MRNGARILVVIGLVGALAGSVGCSGPAGSNGSSGPASSLAASGTSPGSTSGGAPTTTPAGACPVTRPTMFQPPPGVETNALFGSAASHGNGQLWVGGLGEGGVIVRPRDADGWIDNKFGWWRGTQGELRITGRRLDGPALALRAHVPDGYGETGFQSSGVRFPIEGCWEVTGQVGATTLTFVTLVLSA